MRLFKKIVRAILALLPVFSIFFICNGSSYALRHDYNAIIYGGMATPYVVCDGGDCHLDYSNSHYTDTDYITGINRLSVTWSSGNAPDFSRFSVYENLNYNEPVLIDNQCYLRSSSNQINFYNSMSDGINNARTALNFSNLPIFPTNFSFSPTDIGKCYTLDFYSENNSIKSDPSNTWAVYKNFTRETLGNNSSLAFFSTHISPYPTTDYELKFTDRSVSSVSGNDYSGFFSFTRLFDGPLINKFASLTIPLDSDTGYFYDSSNIYSGRHFEFRFYFNFDGSFAWANDISNGQFVVNTTGKDTSNHFREEIFNCTANLITLGATSTTQLEFTCPVDLSYNYLYINPYLFISNVNSYVWDTDNDWQFYSSFVVSDNDWRDGESFNNHSLDRAWSATNGVHGDGSCPITDLGCQLNTAFSFSIPIANTPLGSIFGGFTDSMSCASIPTIANMIHSNETQVCPWFNSTIRSITTPILSLSAIMLTFGFIVRWLGSSSGNETGGGF